MESRNLRGWLSIITRMPLHQKAPQPRSAKSLSVTAAEAFFYKIRPLDFLSGAAERRARSFPVSNFGALTSSKSSIERNDFFGYRPSPLPEHFAGECHRATEAS
jgi:hypothetical protein